MCHFAATFIGFLKFSRAICFLHQKIEDSIPNKEKKGTQSPGLLYSNYSFVQNGCNNNINSPFLSGVLLLCNFSFMISSCSRFSLVLSITIDFVQLQTYSGLFNVSFHLQSVLLPNGASSNRI